MEGEREQETRGDVRTHKKVVCGIGKERKTGEKGSKNGRRDIHHAEEKGGLEHDDDI